MARKFRIMSEQMQVYSPRIRIKPRKLTVEECVQLDSAWMTRERCFDPDGCPEGTITWRDGWSKRVLTSVSYSVCLEQKLIYLTHTVRSSQDPRQYPVRLTTTELPWPGKRWWFRCPVERAGVLCGRRVAKLYLPPGAESYGCRNCHDLAYRSTQDSHKYDRMFEQSSELLGSEFSEMEEVADEVEWMRCLEQKKQRNEQRRERRKAKGWG